MKFSYLWIGNWRKCWIRHFVSMQCPNQMLHRPFDKFSSCLIFRKCDLIDLLQQIVFQPHGDLSFWDHRIFRSDHFTFSSSWSSFSFFSSHKSPICGGLIPEIHFKTFNLKCNLLIYDGNNPGDGKFSPKSQILSKKNISQKVKFFLKNLQKKIVCKICVINLSVPYRTATVNH